MADSPGLPPRFLERLAQILPEAHRESCLDSFAQPKAVSFRINTLKFSLAEGLVRLAELGLSLKSVAWKPDAFWLPFDERSLLTHSSFAQEGGVYLQNLSSMVPPWVLDPQAGECILDLTAAPGSKTLQMACQMGNQGEIRAVECVKSRFFQLRANLQQQGASCVKTYLNDGIRVGQICPEFFDRVLLDAPCSTEGRFSLQTPETYAFWSERKIAEASRKQKQLLSSAVQSLKPGGVLVYSTCSFAPEENEAVLDWMLHQFEGAMEILDFVCPAPLAQAGMTAWQGKNFDPQVSRAWRVLPDTNWEGFFVALCRKKDSTLKEKKGAFNPKKKAAWKKADGIEKNRGAAKAKHLRPAERA